MRVLRVAIVCLAALAGEARAQQADSALVPGPALAAFQDARDVSVSPAGAIFVVDAGRNVVVQFTAGGNFERTFGGPGSLQGQFDRPSAIDPGNGLVLLVADAGNGRIQRFSRDLLHLGSLPVGTDFFEGGPTALQTATRATGEAPDHSGAPSSVAVSPLGETFALDESRGILLKWDAAHRPERIIGGYDGGEGALEEPVKIAVDGRANLYVADRGHGAVLVYDRFGNYVRSLGDGLASEIRSVTAFDGRVWIVLPRRLIAYDANGTLQSVLDLAIGAPLVDAAFTQEAVYLLTASGLYRASLPARSPYLP